MSYEMLDAVQESPVAPAIESSSVFNEAYESYAPRQFKAADESQVSSRNEANQTFGALELFDSSVLLNKGGRSPDAGVKSQPGKTEKIDASIDEEENGTLRMTYKDGTSSTISKDGETVRDFDAQGRQVDLSGKDTSNFDKDGKEPPDKVNPKDIDDLINRGGGILPDIEFFEKRPVPRDDGEIRQRQEPDPRGGTRTTTEYPNGITVQKVEQNIRGDDGKLTKVEETSIKGPEGFKESPKGTFVDKTGKVLAKENEDGTLTVLLDDHGKQKTVTEFPNGVRTVMGDPPTVIKDGKVVNFGRLTTMPEGASQTADGTFIDKKGNPIFKDNGDGSATIFTKNGTYTQQPDGSVTLVKKK